MNPLEVSLDWKGRGLAVETFTTEARAGETTITAEGAAHRDRLNLTALSFANGENMRLQLTKPAELRWGPDVQLSEFDLRGPDGAFRATVTWGSTGSFAVTATRISSEWFRPVIDLPPTEWGIDSLETQGRWSDGPADFAVSAGVTVHLGQDRSAQISAELESAGDGVDISALRVAEGGSVIINATGRVPVVIRPAAEEKWNLAGDAPISFDASTSANPSFWQEITRLTGIEIVDPAAALHLDGSLNKPRGEVRLSATRLAPTDGKFKGVWPKIEALQLHAVADNEHVKLEDFDFSVEGQPVRVSGVLPLKFDDWRELTRNPRAFAQRGEVRVEIPEAEISAFVHYFPEYIAPKGRFQVDLTFRGEKEVEGFIRLQGGTSRPLGPLGVLQEINADIRLDERTANFRAVTARMGGQLVTLQGSAELLPDQLPQLNLTLTGENLPFVRRSGLLIRGDLDLQLITPQRDRAVIRGVVRLRDSLFLADVRSLLPSGGARGVAARPPYFALETPPLNTWGLDVKVMGERFLRLRTPVFNGTATSRFRLSGTLGQPQIAGEAIIDEGNIRLPFASFEVRQGELRLTAGQIEPQIWVVGTTRRYGYDLRMELSGNASSPNLVFSSSPPLEAEQVLLMVMAGEAPSNEISTTDRQRVARFGAFFGQSLLGSLGGDPTGPDRLTISSGGDISEQGRETYSIEYKLADRWALTGEYDEFDDYYGGLKWRIFPKKEGRSDD
jgi:translocation and assembly module TamB